MGSIPDQSMLLPGQRPAWDVALLFPNQGDWTEGEYLRLETNRLVELVDGKLEVLPMPTYRHQQIVWFLADALRAFVTANRIGNVVFAPMPLRIRDKTLREPDVIYIPKEQAVQPRDKQLPGAGLVMEVVSEDPESQKRDYEDKRSDYAELGIPEYWIVDPQRESITVLTLNGSEYRCSGEFSQGQQAVSNLLPGFVVNVDAVFNAGETLQY